MALTDREKRLIERFVVAYNSYNGATFKVKSWPDVVDRTGQAVDAVAADPANGELAIELTLLQPFAGERRDSHVFERTVARLNQNQNLVIADFDIDLCFKVGAVPNGVNWDNVAPAAENWYAGISRELPAGRSGHTVPQLPFQLDVDVWKEPAPGTGNLFVSRRMPDETVEPVVRQALSSKLPKLVAANGDSRILSLEMNSVARGYAEIGNTLEKLCSDFQDLNKIDGVWMVNTVAWDSEDYTPSYLIWPLERAAEFQDQRMKGHRTVA